MSIKVNRTRAATSEAGHEPTLMNSATIDEYAHQLLGDLPGWDQRQTHRLLRDLINTRESIHALGPALTKLSTAATPATARALQATENVWRDLEERYQLLTSTEVAKLLGAKGANRAYASNLRAKRQLLGVHRRNSYLYPGFQFDRRTRRVKTVVPLLLELASGLDWDTDDLTIWLSTPSGYFGGDRPADHLDDTEEVFGKARDAATVQW